jgi:aspartyl/asparaginyl-tRNA synthetase
MTSYKQKYIDISKITPALLCNTITVNGWIRTARVQASVAFIELHDGSTSKTIQLITEDLLLIEKFKVCSILLS